MLTKAEQTVFDAIQKQLAPIDEELHSMDQGRAGRCVHIVRVHAVYFFSGCRGSSRFRTRFHRHSLAGLQRAWSRWLANSDETYDEVCMM